MRTKGLVHAKQDQVCPINGCQIGTSCPILHAKQDQVYPVGLSDEVCAAGAGGRRAVDGLHLWRADHVLRLRPDVCRLEAPQRQVGRSKPAQVGGAAALLGHGNEQRASNCRAVDACPSMRHRLGFGKVRSGPTFEVPAGRCQGRHPVCWSAGPPPSWQQRLE
jgi:hypothetical protein